MNYVLNNFPFFTNVKNSVLIAAYERIIDRHVCFKRGNAVYGAKPMNLIFAVERICL
jgi:hypothetical protein